MTAADRPSVTDNARAEERERAAVTAWTFGMKHGARLVEAREFASLIAKEIRAAGRAETTTATTEDMTTRLAAAEAELDRLCDGGRFTMSIPPREGYDSDLLIQAALSDLRGLLATARPDTTTEPEGTRWWVPAYRTPNSCVQRLGSPTVLREYAEREVEQYRKQEAEDPKGNPDAIFLATRIEHPWTEADRG